MSAPPPPLLALLGARWSLGAPVVGLAWTLVDGAALAGFALGDGTLAMVPAGWDGAPAVEERPGGGVTLVPGRDAPPVARQAVHRGSALAIVGDPAGGFLSGGDDGRFVHVAADGTLSLIGEFAGAWVAEVAASGARKACAAGRAVHLFGAAEERVDLPGAVHALAFDAGGERLAIGHEGGVAVWQAGGGLRRLEAPGRVRALAWSGDGRTLVAGLDEGPIAAWRLDDAAPRSPLALPLAPQGGAAHALSVRGGRWLAASGGARVAVWDLANLGAAPDFAGLSARAAPVSHVACHPGEGPIAAAYGNGAVLLCQPGSEEALFIRAAPAGGVSALGWSPDGTWLALGSEDGEAGMVSMPALLFRTRAATQPPPSRKTA